MGFARLQVGIDHHVLAGVQVEVAHGLRIVAEVMDAHRERAARHDVEQLVPAAAAGRGVVLGVGHLVDGHHRHALDRAVFVGDAAAKGRRRHLRPRRQADEQRKEDAESKFSDHTTKIIIFALQRTHVTGRYLHKMLPLHMRGSILHK